MGKKRKRVRGFKPYNPRPESQVYLRQVIEVLEEYREFWPVTIRQVYYRMIGAHGYPKDANACDRLEEYINRARREPRDVWWKLPFEAFRDDGVQESTHTGYLDAADFMSTVRGAAQEFKLDLMSRQGVHVEILCEAAGMVPQIDRVAAGYIAHVSSAGGFDSTTRKEALARRLSSMGKPVYLFHIGDYDPSGQAMFTALLEDLEAFLWHYGGDVQMVRLAVTPEQIADYNLESSPVNENDNREFDGDRVVQAEAFSPPDLADIVRAGIESVIDMEVHAKALRAEKQIRGKLIRRIETA